MISQTAPIRVPVGHIIVNSRWKNSSIIADLQASVPVHFENSTSAIDFHPSCNTGVVYISEADMVEGISYKRRVARLRKANNVRGIVISEKTPTSSQYFGNVQQFCVSDLGLDLIPVASQSEAAGLLIQMVFVESKLGTNPFLKEPVNSPPDSSILKAVTSFPGVGSTKARGLLDKFSNIESICTATEQELSAVVGRASASKLYKFFHNVT